MSSRTYMPTPPVCLPLAFCFRFVSVLKRLNPSIFSSASSCDFNHVSDSPPNKQLLLHNVMLIGVGLDIRFLGFFGKSILGQFFCVNGMSKDGLKPFLGLLHKNCRFAPGFCELRYCKVRILPPTPTFRHC